MQVETGEGLEYSESYVSLDFADRYFASRGESSWDTLELNDKLSALIKGTDYVDNSFDWKGKKATAQQSLNFPRVNLRDKNGYEVTGIPFVLKKAVCVAALSFSKGEELFVTKDTNGAVTSESIGALHFSYDVSQKEKFSTIFEEINLLLKGLYKDYSIQKVKQMNVKRVL